MTAMPPVVLFGVTGDLARKKLLPALYRLWRDEGFRSMMVGVGRRDWSDDQLRDRARMAVSEAGEPAEPATMEAFCGSLRYLRGDYSDKLTFDALAETVGPGANPLAFLAIPPEAFGPVVEGLARVGLNQAGKVVVEKPFGRDLASALELNRILLEHYPEQAIFRIDHFLGKEPVQNILITRFSNGIFEPLWNRHHVQSVQVTMAESFGVDTRGAFFDQVGTLRDVVQNHLLQLVALLAMEPPNSEGAPALRDEVNKVMGAMVSVDPANVVRGQYLGYRDHDGVSADSRTDTFVALRLEIDNWRWAGVPFYIRAGKSMSRTLTEAVVEFRAPPRPLFADPDCHPHPNHLRFRVKPDDCTSLHLQAKLPGDRLVGRGVELDVSVSDALGDGPEAYERLLSDAMAGDQRLFARQDAVEEAWRVFENVLEASSSPLEYAPGGSGPAESDEVLLATDSWHD
ncbi:MAG: glucose-6-phosphate dehydrogenase [Acidimicrobiales bacterium]